jgi:hypothetical protein
VSEHIPRKIQNCSSKKTGSVQPHLTQIEVNKVLQNDINEIAQGAANYHNYCIQIVLEQVGRGLDKQGY